MEDPVRSAEPGRTKPYDEDLRWRGIWSILVHGRTYCWTASLLGVCPTTVCNWWVLFLETGDVVGRPHVVEPRLDDYGTIFLFTILERQPSLRLYECCRILQEDLGIEISVSGLCRFLHRMGWSRKKLQVKALQRCLHCRLDFIQHVMLAFPASSLVWVDECGCRCSCCLRNRGWAPLGVTPEEYRRFSAEGTCLA